MSRIFVSYSHDDNAHQSRVHALADRLRTEEGLNIIIDRDTGPGGPNEGWLLWSERQVKEADRVLIVCSAQYALRYEGNDGDSDRGRGTVMEARAIQQLLYESKGRNARFRVVVFHPSAADDIPLQLRGYHYFNASDDSSYRQLVAWLKEVVSDGAAPVPEGPIWPKPDLDFQLPLADRRPHFDVVRASLSGLSSNRIFLFEGAGASGKTQFLNELTTYAERVGIPWTQFDFKSAPPLEDFFVRVVLDLGAECLRDTQAAKSKTPLVNLVADLKRLTTPALFVFDTFEQASEESRKWVEGMFLPSVRNLPAVVVIIGGREVPDRTQYPWKSLAEFRTLEPIKNAEDWSEYLYRVHQGELELRHIETLTLATEGQPGNMRPLLETLMKSVMKPRGTD